MVMMTLESGSFFSFSLHMSELFTFNSFGTCLLPLVSMYFLHKYSSSILSLATVLFDRH